MLVSGENIIDGVPVVTAARKAKNIIIRVKPDGTVSLTIPLRRATFAQGEAFLRSKWEWVLETRKRALSAPTPREREFSPMDVARLETMLGRLHAQWAARLGELGVSWKLRRMKTRWGVCNFAKRRITYATMLAGETEQSVEYVVVHELTHLKAHGHGPAFKSLMDSRLPDWKERRRALGK
ncbi:MAG: DUF45 domain-containing protein [Kiritimatiellae bacterium]|nr:DUF45 domain-containing protein [Kiritimatiellia bacterium]